MVVAGNGVQYKNSAVGLSEFISDTHKCSRFFGSIMQAVLGVVNYEQVPMVPDSLSQCMQKKCSINVLTGSR